MSVNKAIIIGHLGRDPEIRGTKDGREIASFSVATSESWKDKAGQKQEKTEWHSVVIFNDGLVGVVKSYLKKGSKVYIEGKIQTRKWLGNDGKDNYATEIILQGFSCQLVMLSKNDDKGSQPARQPTPSDDEIPF